MGIYETCQTYGFNRGLAGFLILTLFRLVFILLPVPLAIGGGGLISTVFCALDVSPIRLGPDVWFVLEYQCRMDSLSSP